jgi:CheY-like chemotaxis protein
MAKTLFVADNNELDLRILRLILVRSPVFGCELYFKDGRSLIEYIKSNMDDVVNLPDVIFIDTNMPDCWSALELLKVNYERLIKPFVVYVLSTSVDVNKIQRALSYPFVKEFIPKPINRDKILEIAKEVDSSRV